MEDFGQGRTAEVLDCAAAEGVAEEIAWFEQDGWSDEAGFQS
jgi:hypothetical protein